MPYTVVLGFPSSFHLRHIKFLAQLPGLGKFNEMPFFWALVICIFFFFSFVCFSFSFHFIFIALLVSPCSILLLFGCLRYGHWNSVLLLLELVLIIYLIFVLGFRKYETDTDDTKEAR